MAGFTERDELEDIMIRLERLLPKLERIFNALPPQHKPKPKLSVQIGQGRGSKKPPAKLASVGEGELL